MNRLLILTARAALAAGTLFAGSLLAHDEPHGKPITLTAEVIDTGCYMSHDHSDGEDHLACAKTCANAGVPLGLVDSTGKVYTLVAADHKNPNTKLIPFLQKKVKITGTLLQKGGLNGIAIKTIEPAD
jgi:hypothetical protein